MYTIKCSLRRYVQWALGDREHSLNEMAQINMRNNRQNSALPSPQYKVYITDENAHKKFWHLHISNQQDGWDARFHIPTGEFHSAKRFGKRKRTDKFTDIERLLKQWLQMKSAMAIEMTNCEYAMLQWESMNEQD